MVNVSQIHRVSKYCISRISSLVGAGGLACACSHSVSSFFIIDLVSATWFLCSSDCD